MFITKIISNILKTVNSGVADSGNDQTNIMSINEQTSNRVASIAAKIMTMQKPDGMPVDLWNDIKTLAGSALTQAPDKLTGKFDLNTIDHTAYITGLSSLGMLGAARYKAIKKNKFDIVIEYNKLS